MPSTSYYLQGKAMWVQTKSPDKFNKYGVVLYPNEKSLELLRELQSKGILNRMKKDDNGYFMRISSKASKEVKGVIRAVNPPFVLDKDGKPMDDLVGNGSDVTCKVNVYTYPTPTGGKGIAMQLDSIRVDNLIPYTRDSFPEELRVATEGLDDQPAELW